MADQNPLLRVSIDDGTGGMSLYQFDRSFRLGRSADNDISVNSPFVSRHHLETYLEAGQWHVRDLNSSNGLYIDGERVPVLAIPHAASVRLGTGGPFVNFEAIAKLAEPVPQPVPQPAPPPPPSVRAPVSPSTVRQATESKAPSSVKNYGEYYFKGDADDSNAGEHTRLVRQAFAQVQKSQRSKWLVLVGVLGLVILGVSTFAFVEHRNTLKQRALAEDIFYSMKGLDVDIANFERVVLDTNHPGVISELAKYRRRREEVEKHYDEFLLSLKVVDAKLPPPRRLIMRVARIFGECELNMPADFESEVTKYIDKWRSSSRFKNAIQAARANGYDRVIAREMLDAGLPPQFFYLALQESGFDPWISGPDTYMGIAKGMWQFIPQTAIKYGLKIGPLAQLRRPDPGDDRNQWQAETKAAAHYMKDLYGTDAQASGLLVMACYNWGEAKVLPLVRSLPADPRDRNFWRLLTKYRDKLPKETYDYVFYIISAAVIGEDPHAFGFDMENPLAHLNDK